MPEIRFRGIPLNFGSEVSLNKWRAKANAMAARTSARYFVAPEVQVRETRRGVLHAGEAITKDDLLPERDPQSMLPVHPGTRFERLINSGHILENPNWEPPWPKDAA
jgi:hypothetical protein